MAGYFLDRPHTLTVCSVLSTLHVLTLFKKIFYLFLYLFIFRGRGREEESEGETLMCKKNTDLLHAPQLGTGPATQACALIRNQTSNLSLCETMPNPEPHWSGCVSSFDPYSSPDVVTSISSTLQGNAAQDLASLPKVTELIGGKGK